MTAELPGRDRNREIGCPSWCQLVHGPSPVLAHESDTHLVTLSHPREGHDEFLSVRTVEYLPLDMLDSTESWGALVEIEHHVGDRYRVINLTAEDARKLAAHLLSCADESEERANGADRSATAPAVCASTGT
jgi:hypothetical protein